MSALHEEMGRTIQIFLVDGVPTGLTKASIHGWTGSVLVATQSTYVRLLERPEVDRASIYILHGEDPDDTLKSTRRMRVYIGEAESVRERIGRSTDERSFWETAIVVTSSDETLTKGDVRYLEARLIAMTTDANRVTLDNTQIPDPERRWLPEADRSNMEAFLANLKMVLPVLGLDFLKPQPILAKIGKSIGVSIEPPAITDDRFEIPHKSGVKATAFEEDGEFVVIPGSQALKDKGFSQNSYGCLKQNLIDDGTLLQTSNPELYEFSKPHSFRSPSAAAAVILDRNTNGRIAWHLVGSDLTYHEWQQRKYIAPEPALMMVP
jgi:hypothetical protein